MNLFDEPQDPWAVDPREGDDGPDESSPDQSGEHPTLAFVGRIPARYVGHPFPIRSMELDRDGYRNTAQGLRMAAARYTGVLRFDLERNASKNERLAYALDQVIRDLRSE